jgi:hypothetical protein
MSAAPIPEPAYGTHTARNAGELHQLAEQFTAIPVPHLFDLYRETDPTAVSGTGRIATGMIFPFGGGAVCRWSAPCSPAGWPFPVRQAEVFDNIAEALAVHGHLGATVLRTYDVTDPDGSQLDASRSDRTTPEAFAVQDESRDVPEWGVWYPEGDRAVTWAPPVTPRSGRQQADRYTLWRSLPELVERVGVRTGPGKGRVVFLTSTTGRFLVRDVRGALASGMRHARQARDTALANLPAL